MILFTMKKTNIIIVFLVIAMVFSIYLCSAENIIFNQSFYKKEFSKNNAYSEFNNADSIGNALILFFKGNKTLPDVFTKDEALHLIDVRNLVNNGNIFLLILILSGIILLSFLLFYSENKRKDLANASVLSGILILSFPAALIFFRFNDIFTKFHHIFFPQGNYIFDASSALIRLFPEQFFYDALIDITIKSAAIGLLLIFIGVFSSKTSSN